MGDGYLFVYGTLRRGFKHPMANVLARQADFVGLGKFQGQLYDLGSYPGVKPSRRIADVVVGDVYRLHIPVQLLSQFDRYEDYDPGDPAQSLYLRQSAPILMNDGRSLYAWIYIYNRSTPGHRLIESGDYLQYLQDNL